MADQTTEPDPVAASEELQAAFAPEWLEATEAAGGRWLVRIIKAGTSKNGRHYSQSVLEAAAKLFEGKALQMMDVGEGDEYYSHAPVKVRQLLGGGGLARAIVGVLRNVRYDETRTGLVGEAVITAPWLAQTMTRITEATGGALKALGLSINARIRGVRDATRMLVQEIVGVESVDLVTSPAAGGEFMTALEAVAEALGEESMAAEQHEAAPVAGDQKNDQAISAALESVDAKLQALEQREAEIQQLVEQQKAEAHRARVESAVESIAKGYDDGTRKAAARVVLAETTPDSTGDEVRTACESFVADLPKPAPAGGRKITMGAEESDKMTDGLVQLVLESSDPDASAPAFPTLKRAYQEFTGDIDMVGHDPALALEAAIETGSWSVALGTAMHKRLIRAYRNMGDFGARRLVSTTQRLADFKAHNLVRIGGFADIPQVSAGDGYTTASIPSEESTTITALKYGQILEIWWETIVNDDLGSITRAVDGFGRAAARTLWKAVYEIFSAGFSTTIGIDSKYLYHADHSNLQTTSFGYAGLNALIALVEAQTESGSSAPLGIQMDQGGLLIIGRTNKEEVMELLNARGKPGVANNDGSALMGVFGAPKDGGLPERVVLDPFRSGATLNDYQILANPQQWETLVLGYYGSQEPEMLYAGNPQAYNAWYNDIMEYRVKHCWGLSVADYRTTAGSNVT